MSRSLTSERGRQALCWQHAHFRFGFFVAAVFPAGALIWGASLVTSLVAVLVGNRFEPASGPLYLLAAAFVAFGADIERFKPIFDERLADPLFFSLLNSFGVDWLLSLFLFSPNNFLIIVAFYARSLLPTEVIFFLSVGPSTAALGFD